MLDALYTAASGMLAQQIGMDVIANNLANVNTDGYKAQRAAVRGPALHGDRARGRAPRRASSRAPACASRASRPSRRGLDASEHRRADRLRDHVGNGYFVVRKPDGTHGLHPGRRTSARRRRAAGDAAGDLVLDQAGRPIPFPRTCRRSRWTPSGNVTAVVPAGRVRVAQLGMMQFVNPYGLTLNGRNLYLRDRQLGRRRRRVASTGTGGTIIQGFLEKSNVNAVDEMVGMITTQRAYEAVGEDRAPPPTRCSASPTRCAADGSASPPSGPRVLASARCRPACTAPTTAQRAARCTTQCQAVRGRVRAPARVADARRARAARRGPRAPRASTRTWRTSR